MPKLTKQVPPPAPPPTFDLTGLTERQAFIILVAADSLLRSYKASGHSHAQEAEELITALRKELYK